MKRPQSEQLKAVPEPLDSQHRTARKPERETFAVYRLPGEDDDASAEREFLLTLPIDQDVERRIKKDYGAGSYRVERRRGGRYVSVVEMHFDEPPQRGEASATESSVPEDFDERLAQAVEEVLESRRIERQRARAVKSNPAPSVPPQQPATAAPDPLNDLVRTVSVLKQLGVPIGEAPRGKPTEPTKDEDDRVLLSLLKDGELRRRVSTSISSLIGGADTAERHWLEVAADALERHPKLVARIGDLGARFLPKKEEPDDDDDAAVSVEDRCADYLLEKCAANEPVTLQDEPLRALAAASPDDYQELILGLQAGSVDQIIAHLSEQFEGARFVLRTPHARSWIEQLKEVAAAT
jgi:hypothetical protein